MGTEFSVSAAVALGMKTNVATYLFASALVLLFVLTGLDKVYRFQEFSEHMSMQIFGKAILPFVTFFIPAAEISCAVLLVFAKTRFAGFAVSAMIMLTFTGYAGLIVLHVFAKRPCPCGGPLEHMGWGFHLVFNACFLAVSVLGLIFTISERRHGKLAA